LSGNAFVNHFSHERGEYGEFDEGVEIRIPGSLKERSECSERSVESTEEMNQLRNGRKCEIETTRGRWDFGNRVERVCFVG